MFWPLNIIDRLRRAFEELSKDFNILDYLNLAAATISLHADGINYEIVVPAKNVGAPLDGTPVNFIGVGRVFHVMLQGVERIDRVDSEELIAELNKLIAFYDQPLSSKCDISGEGCK